MAFKLKKDCYSLGGDGALVAVSTSEGKSASVVEAQGQDGSIVASEVFGETSAPTVDYQLKKALETTIENAIKLGKVTKLDNNSFVLSSFSITTGAGAVPTVSAGGEQVAGDSETLCTFDLPPFKLETKHHAQILFGAFELTGAGCHLTGANYNASCTVSKAMKEGACLAFDVVGGKIECQITVKACGDLDPVLVPGEGWKVTAPLTESNPDSEYPTYSGTLTRYLSKSTINGGTGFA
jgi:hypothetical protein